MSNLREKAIEIAKQTSSESAFMCGYDRACKEYEEKLRWIPVEEKMPERDKNVLIKRSAPFHKYELTAFNRDGIFYSNETAEKLTNVTHWRSIFL